MVLVRNTDSCPFTAFHLFSPGHHLLRGLPPWAGIWQGFAQVGSGSVSLSAANKAIYRLVWEGLEMCGGSSRLSLGGQV